MAGVSDIQSASALFQAGRLYELIGVSPGASRGELKAACRAAQLRAHPDKGGDTEVFKVLDAAVQLLLNDFPRFDGPPPTQATDLMAKIEERRYEIDNWEARLAVLRFTLAKASTDREKAATQRSLATAECLLAGDVTELTSLRDEYFRFHREHARKQEEWAAWEERMTERARQKAIRAAREKDALRKRRSRKPSTRFPTLPRMDLGAARPWRDYGETRAKFRKLSQTRSRYARQGMDVTSIDRQLEVLLNQARAIVDAAMAAKCEARGMLMTFPRLARTHPMYDSLAELRTAHRRLWDRMRKYKAGEDLEAQDAEILRKAWGIIRGEGAATQLTQMSVDVDPIDTNVR
jgi:curved DNA-binding protein CbpA